MARTEPPSQRVETGAARKAPDVLRVVRERITSGKRLVRTLPEGGRVHVDRPLPFIIVYRPPEDRPDPGTDTLVTAAASHLAGGPGKRAGQELVRVVRAYRDCVQERFGSFLVIQVWSRHPGVTPVAPERVSRAPAFRVMGRPEGEGVDALLAVLVRRLEALKHGGRRALVQQTDWPPARSHRAPRPLFTRSQEEEGSLVQIGIEVEPYYRREGTEEVYPGVLRVLRRAFLRALNHGIYAFVTHETSYRPRNFHALGRRVFSKAAWEVDRQLDEVTSGFDFLLEVNPVNADAAWRGFRRSKFERLPALRYRPLPIDPGLAKRALFSIPLERVQDPTLAILFRQKQDELDRKITMLADRGTRRFLLGSMQLYGEISDSLVRTSERILENIPATRQRKGRGRHHRTEEFAALAREEIAHYRRIWDEVDATVQISPRVASLMVSRGHLLIASGCRPPQSRIDALLQHEVGTHLVTYYNGKAQKLTQLRTGLAGYEELQEGLAVLAEHLVGGMTPDRLRTLAGRVIACKALVDGATFVDTFRLLCRCGFAQKTAFSISLRIYRGGGLTKDCIYLRGLRDVLKYLRGGGELERLFVGKIATKHIPIMEELESRRVVLPPRILPRYLERPDCQQRLAALRAGQEIHELLNAE